MTTADFNPMNVVLVSQDEDDGFILSDVIAKLSYEVQFKHLHNCTGFLNKISGDQIPQFIILELSTPFHLGIQCLKKIRQDETLKDVPVAIYSAYINSKVVRESFEAGANFFLVKPNSYGETFQLIKKLFTSGWEMVRDKKVFTRDFIMHSDPV